MQLPKIWSDSMWKFYWQFVSETIKSSAEDPYPYFHIDLEPDPDRILIFKQTKTWILQKC